MATVREFMEMVVPWPEQSGQGPGWVNLHWTTPGEGAEKRFRGRPYKLIDEFIGQSQWCAANPNKAREVYFCLSRQITTGKVFKGIVTALRNQRNVLDLKSIWLDIDVGKEGAYATLSEALEALGQFVHKSRLPAPSAVVFSGGGVHVYWSSTVPLTQDEWRPYAEGLEALARVHGLKCDYGVTIDSARVLRVPGTYNYKTTPPNPVRVAGVGEAYNFGVDLAHIKSTIKPIPTITTIPRIDERKFPRRPLPPGSPASLSLGITGYDDTPLAWEPVLDCPHFVEALSTGGAGYSQGLWMLDVLACTFLDQGDYLAHRVSNGYKGYSHEETEKMLERKRDDREKNGLGWPSCEAIEREGCKSCAGCPLRGKIKSPLSLATRPVAKHIPVSGPHIASNGGTSSIYQSLSLPEGYTLDAANRICEIVTRQIADGFEKEELAPLFFSVLREAETQSRPRGICVITSLDKGREAEVFIAETDMANDGLLFSALRKVGIKPYVRNEKRIRQFMTAWLDKVDTISNRRDAVSYGWVIENGKRIGFVYGGKEFRQDGKTLRARWVEDNLRDNYTPTGEEAHWWKCLKYVTGHNPPRPDLELGVAVSFASPLIHEAGLYASVLCLMSSESGAGKSTSLRTGAAVWGNPKLTKEVPSASKNALLGKLAKLRNLPVVWDEISDAQKIKHLAFSVGEVGEGIEGSKMHQDRTLRDKGDGWQSLIACGCNKSLWGEIIAQNKDTDAQLRRIFEVEVPRIQHSQYAFMDVQRDVEKLDHNYGKVGLKYAEWLGRNPDKVEQTVASIIKDFSDQAKAEKEERFWVGLAGTIMAGAAIANAVLGTDFHLEEMYNFLLKQFQFQRNRIESETVVGATAGVGEEALTMFLKECSQNTLWSKNMHMGSRGKPAPVVKLFGPPESNKQPIHVQFVTDHNLLRVSRDEFVRFFVKRGYAYGSVMGSLKRFFAAKDTMASMVAGTTYTGGREKLIEIPLTADSPWFAAMNAYQSATRLGPPAGSLVP